MTQISCSGLFAFSRSGTEHFKRQISCQTQMQHENVFAEFFHSREQIDDLQVRFTTQVTAQILRHWIACLHQTLQELHTEMYQQRLAELKVLAMQRVREEKAKLEECNEVKVTEPEDNFDEDDDDSYRIVVKTKTEKTDENGPVAFDQNSRANKDKPDDDMETVQNRIQRVDVEDVHIDPSEVKNVCDTLEQSLHVSDPFPLEADLHCQVAQLALLCFQYEVHGHPSIFRRPLLFPTTNTSSTCGNFEDEQNGPKKVMTNLEATRNIEDHQVGLLVPPTQTDETDEELGILLKSHFHLFKDNVTEVARTLDGSASPKEHCWDAFLQCLEGKTLFICCHFSELICFRGETVIFCRANLTTEILTVSIWQPGWESL